MNTAGEGDPYYPIPRRENTEIYRKYQELAEGPESFRGKIGNLQVLIIWTRSLPGTDFVCPLAISAVWRPQVAINWFDTDCCLHTAENCTNGNKVMPGNDLVHIIVLVSANLPRK